MWPPESPNLNTIDFSVWSMSKAKVSYIEHPSVLLREWAEIPGCTTIQILTIQIPTIQIWTI